MNMKAMLHDKRVWYGVAGIAVLAGAYIMLRSRSSSSSNATTAGDTSYLSFGGAALPVDNGGTSTGVDVSQLLSYSNSQAQIAANQNLAAVSSSFIENMTQTLVGSNLLSSGGKGGLTGYTGSFNIAGQPINFDFTFKGPGAIIQSPPDKNTVAAA